MTAAALRTRILASSGMSYSGYAESDATFGLPSLSGLSDVTSLEAIAAAVARRINESGNRATALREDAEILRRPRSLSRKDT